MSVNDLPEGDLLVRVHYSSLNYKDALSATGNRGVTRNFPHTPGIDAAGIVEESRTDAFKPGDAVIVTSYDLGMNTAGGFAEYIRVPAEWAVPLPEGLSLKESMIFGTAGLTAGMSALRLTEVLSPESGPVLVSGATGGVGSMACAILTHLGYSVTAVTGKSNSTLLADIGVKEIISRQELLENSDAPLLKTRWAGAIDTVGGEILTVAIKGTRQDGIVTCCGNAASADLPLTVFPFILRGVCLAGIDSQHYPMEKRQTVWQKLSSDWKFARLDQMSQEVGLDQMEQKIEDILKGRLQGRVLLKL